MSPQARREQVASACELRGIRTPEQMDMSVGVAKLNVHPCVGLAHIIGDRPRVVGPPQQSIGPAAGIGWRRRRFSVAKRRRTAGRLQHDDLDSYLIEVIKTVLHRPVIDLARLD